MPRIEQPWKPTPAQLQAASNKRVPDLIQPGLSVLFCGINPGLYSAAVRHHFARPGNLFWPTLFASGFTPRRLGPFDEHQLLALGLGITNIVARATASADQLSSSEIHAGAQTLSRKLHKFRPRYLAVLGLGAYRIAFRSPRATVGLQPDPIGSTSIWLLPNPSGLNAHHQPPILKRMFCDLRRAALGST